MSTKLKKTGEALQQGVREIYSARNPEIDVVVIPGLQADPIKSWETDGFSWLTDEEGICGKTFPRCRVLVYEYLSNWSGELKVDQTMSNLAMTLLTGLYGKREKVVRRPIIFLGHSMGGLIIAEAGCIAVRRAKERRDSFGNLFEAISGCVFFGTPFKGANTAVAAHMIADARVLFGLDMPTTSSLLKLMEPGNQPLADLRNEFLRLARVGPGILLFCFFEEVQTEVVDLMPSLAFLGLQMPLPRTLAKFVTADSAALEGVDRMGLKKIHRNLVKFDGPEDEVFSLVRSQIKIIMDKAPTIAKDRFISARNVDHRLVKMVLEELEGFPVYRKLQKLKDAIRPSFWLLDEIEMEDWLEGQQQHNFPSGLWIYGPDGRGSKTGASIAAIDCIQQRIRDRHEESILLAYFFCDNDDDASSAEELIKSLLRQLIAQHEALAIHCRSFTRYLAPNGLEQKAQTEPMTLENILRSFKDILHDLRQESVYFVINSIHSLRQGPESTTKVMEFIQEQLTTPMSQTGSSPEKSRTKVHWLITSQYLQSISEHLKVSVCGLIDLDDPKYGDKLRKQLRERAKLQVGLLSKQQNYTKALAYSVESFIGTRAQDQSWIDITVKRLGQLPASSKDAMVRGRLNRMPLDLDALLNETWSSIFKCNEEDAEDIKEILRALVVAFEEPTEFELAVLTGLANDAEHRARLHALIGDCRPLLSVYTVNNINKVSFLTSKVKEHLTKNSESLLGLSKEEIDRQHGVLALRCFSHVMRCFETSKLTRTSIAEDALTTFAEDDDGSTEASTGIQRITDEIEIRSIDVEVESDHKFEVWSDEDVPEDHHSKYITKHWLRHASKATDEVAELLSNEVLFWDLDSPVRMLWLREYKEVDDLGSFKRLSLEGLSALHVASSVGFPQLVSALLKNGHTGELHTYDTFGSAPIHLAAACNQVDTLEVLLQAGGRIDDCKNATPLIMAAWNGQLQAMEKLLQWDAEVNARSKTMGTALNQAILSGKLDCVKLLIENHASVHDFNLDDPDNFVYLAPISLSALLSGRNIFGYLMKACWPSMPQPVRNQALNSAAMAGRMDAVNQLTHYEYSNLALQTALSRAAENQQWDTMRFFFERYSVLDVGDVLCQVAAAKGDPKRIDDMVLTIWKYSLKHEPISQELRNKALYHAVDMENESTVRILLEDVKADANATGEKHGNALTASAYHGTEDIIKILLDNEANVNDPSGWALQIAAREGHKNIVDLLLKHGADVNARLAPGHLRFSEGTALQAACGAGHVDITDLLLKAKNIDVNLGNGISCPILVAALAGEGEIVTQLIGHGADLKCAEYNTKPLIAAAATLSEDFLEKILGDNLKEPQVEINDADFKGDTALITAARVDNAESVCLLLERGADILHTNFDNRNALEVAIEKQSLSSIQVLAAAASRIFRQLKDARDTGESDVLDVLGTVDYIGLSVPASGKQTDPNLEEKPSKGACDEDEATSQTGEPRFEKFEARAFRRMARGLRQWSPSRFIKLGSRRQSA